MAYKYLDYAVPDCMLNSSDRGRHLLPDHVMRFFGSLFRLPPSAEYTRPNLTNIQVVYKRIFDHLLERGDLYKRDAFSGLETVKACLLQELYLKLRVEHDA